MVKYRSHVIGHSVGALLTAQICCGAQTYLYTAVPACRRRARSCAAFPVWGRAVALPYPVMRKHVRGVTSRGAILKCLAPGRIAVASRMGSTSWIARVSLAALRQRMDHRQCLHPQEDPCQHPVRHLHQHQWNPQRQHQGGFPSVGAQSRGKVTHSLARPCT